MAAVRVGLFVDYMNAYNSAREAFCDPLLSTYTDGQFYPRALGQRIVDRGPQGRRLEFVRVYRGLPDPRQNAKGNRACQREAAEWKRSGVTPFLRPVKVYRGGNVREKGIDVQIAIDMVLGALERRYDVAVLMSNDNDLVPALEAVLRIGQMLAANNRPAPQIEVAAWKPANRGANQLRVAGADIHCHLLTEQDYDAAQNPTDYTL